MIDYVLEFLKDWGWMALVLGYFILASREIEKENEQDLDLMDHQMEDDPSGMPLTIAYRVARGNKIHKENQLILVGVFAVLVYMAFFK